MADQKDDVTTAALRGGLRFALEAFVLLWNFVPRSGIFVTPAFGINQPLFVKHIKVFFGFRNSLEKFRGPSLTCRAIKSSEPPARPVCDEWASIAIPTAVFSSGLNIR